MKYIVILLLFWAVLELRAKWQEFCDWLESEAESLHRDRIRKAAIETNILLYQQTGERYYMERVRELGKEVNKKCQN